MNKTQGIEIAEQLRNRCFIRQVAEWLGDRCSKCSATDELLDQFGRMDEIEVDVKRRDRWKYCKD